jgi:PST family polysaccharide transporter
LPSEFKRKTIKGLRWGTIDQMSFMVMVQVTNLLLMRILGPTEFGIIGMVNVFANFGNILVTFGIPAFIIQRKELDDGILSTCFWGNLMLGASVTAVLVTISPFVAQFYHEPRVEDVMVVLSLFFVIESTSYVQRALLNRDLDLKSLFKARFISTLISCAVAIWVAMETHSVWAIVVRIGGLKILFTLLSFYYNRWIPKWRFSRQTAGQIVNFTGPLLGSNGVNYFIINFDTLMVGRYMGTDATAFYQKSFEFLRLPATNITQAINRVMLASFSKIQDDKARIRDTYLKVCRMTAYVAFPLMIFLLIEAENFVLGILGPEWSPMIPVVRVMTVGGLVMAVSALNSNIYISQGRTRIHMYNTIIGSIFLIIGVLAGLNYGIFGVAVGVSLAMLLGYLAGIFFVQQLIELSMLENLINYARVTAAVVLFGIILFGLDHLVFGYLTAPVIEQTEGENMMSLYRILHMGGLFILALPLYWGCTKLLKTDYSAQLIEDLLSKRIADKLKNIF